MKTYEDGLHEAWDLAQKIVLSPRVRGDAYTVTELDAIFNQDYYENVLVMPIDEVRKLLSAPKVGDVYAKGKDEKCVIMHIGNNGGLNYMRSDGTTGHMFTDSFLTSGWKKTGENLSEVTAILNKLGGGENV